MIPLANRANGMKRVLDMVEAHRSWVMALDEGYWSHDELNGRGRLIHFDGDYYVGELKNDKPHGYDTYQFEI